jgi:coenzyme PQQ precursor peptide PqqA
MQFLLPRFRMARSVLSIPSVTSNWEHEMTWTKPEFEVVEVTMEVTAYVARR